MKSISNFDGKVAYDLAVKNKHRTSFQTRQVLRKIKRLAKCGNTAFYCKISLKEETKEQLRLKGFEVENAQIYDCIIRWNNTKQGE